MSKFKARKSRERKSQQPIAESNQLIPSAGIARSYERELCRVISAAIKETKAEIAALMLLPSVQSHFSPDLPPAQCLSHRSSDAIGDVVPTLFRRLLWKTKRRYAEIFDLAMGRIVAPFIDKIDENSKSSVRTCIGQLGAGYRDQETGDLNSTLQGYIAENVRLITKLRDDQYDRIEQIVNESIISPDSGKQGISAIFSHLTDVEGVGKKRAKLIATDQTKKAYTSINTQRMRDAGLTKFKWIHSSAGKTPRPCHVARDGNIYSLAGGPDQLFWPDGTDAQSGDSDADRGKPGYAINCRCRQVAVLDLIS